MSGQSLCVWGPGALCVDPALLCVGAQCRAPALCLSGPGAFCVRVRAGPGGLASGARRSLCRGAPICVEAWRSLVGPRLSVSGPVSGPGALCVGCRRSLCRMPALSVSGPDRAPLSRCVLVTQAPAAGPASPQLQPACHSFGPVLLPPIRFRGPPAPISDPRATHAVLWVFPACQPDVLHHVSRHRKHVQPLAGNADANTGQFHQGTSSPTVVCARISPAATTSSDDEASVPFAFSGHKNKRCPLE